MPAPNLIETFEALGLDGDSFARWRTCLRAVHALPPEPGDVEVFRHHTGLTRWPTQPVKRFFGIIGRGGGKSYVASKILSVRLLDLLDLDRMLNTVLLCVAQDTRGARIVFREIKTVIDDSPRLSAAVERMTLEMIEFTNGLTVEIRPNSGKSLAGPTYPVACLDELALWPLDEWSPWPDVATVSMLDPAMARTPVKIPGTDYLLVCISTPHARKGVLWEAFTAHYGNDAASERDRVLVWRATTTEMNPLFPQAEVDRALARDPAWARSQYLAEFRDDISAFIAEETIERCVVLGRRELPPVPGVRYHGFVDPTGGQHDSWTLGIAHREKSGLIVLDHVQEWRSPLDPAAVIRECKPILERYGVRRVLADNFGAEITRSLWNENARGIEMVRCEQTKKELYLSLIPLLSSGKVQLLDDRRLLGQLRNLERRVVSGGEVIDHPPNGMDDLINSACGAIVTCGSALPAPAGGAVRGLGIGGRRGGGFWGRSGYSDGNYKDGL